MISSIAAGSASITHIRAGRVNWKLFAWLLPPSVIGALVGGYLSGVIPDRLLTVFIAVVLLFSGIDLLRWQRSRETVDREHEIKRKVTVVILLGFFIGLLGGVVGLILGSLRMPALIRVIGEDAHKAVGTNLLVGFFVGIFGLIGHLASSSPSLQIIVLGSVFSIPGAIIGARLTGKLSELLLIRVIGCILLIAALVLVIKVAT